MGARKTVFFERVFGVNIDSIKTTKEVDEVVERRRNRKMRVVEIISPVVYNRGNVFKIRKYDIEKLVSEALG